MLRDSHGIFISYEDMEINDNEGDALLHHLQKFREIGIKLEELTVDGKYPTYENIAKNAVTESAGLKPAERVDEMVVKVMEEICIDINKKKPALLYQRRIKILISLL
ncbi:MAG TPA: hypothetical protein ENI33_07555 [Thermoplasmatales archaeon]|nr:hypothetical protein [Thermoplasmatales archaeon]